MPQPLRDSTLITEGQQHIAQAMTLIAATSERYAAAAAALHSTTAKLPTDAKTPPEQPDSPSPGQSATTSQAPDTPLSASTSPDPGGVFPAAADTMPTIMPAQDPLSSPAMMSALPSTMGAMQNAAPAMAAPMTSMLPAAASPVSSLAGLANQFGGNPTSTPPVTEPGADGPTPSPSQPRSVDAAIDAALDALGITDPAARARWHAGYDTLIARESAGNAHSVNRWDSNARGPIQSDGAPAGSSRGLTQMTPATFQRYRLPGLSTNIYDPVSNIAASMRYVMDVHHVDPSGINLAANVQQANQRARAKGY